MNHRRGAEGAENYLFCLSGDDDEQEHFSSESQVNSPIAVSRLGKNSTFCGLGVVAQKSLFNSFCRAFNG
jgi:hypothetical protein